MNENDPLSVDAVDAAQAAPAARHVLVLGLGVSGLAMARWCAAAGAEVTVADTRAEPPQLHALRQAVPQARFVAGDFSAELLDGITQVLRSPGLSPAQLAPLSQAAAARGLPLQGELDLFVQALQDLRASQGYAPAVLAVTGTNGKTTVTSLTAQLVERTGRTVAVAGNIGPALMDTLAERLASGALPQVWVLELSSFQLDGVQGFEPTAATVLNLTQDHLDWHGDMQAYARAKSAVWGQHGVAILNRDDPAVMALMDEGPQPAQASSRKVRAARASTRPVITFGAEPPQRPGDFGIEVVNGMAWLVRAHEADETQKRRRGAAVEEEELHLQRLMPADALRIRGRHNATNALAALALATAAGGSLAPMLYGLREYRGEPHRMQPVATIDGVEYVDDSKGTNVGATVAALEGLQRRVVVILGGDAKGQDFAPLAPALARHARAAVLIGRDAPRIRAAVQSTGVQLFDASSMQDAVEQASRCAQAGDAVLLSPACASFDMFRDYAHRAEAFCAAVAQQAVAAGGVMEGLA